MARRFTLHNNNDENLSFFISNEFIDISKSIWIFSMFSRSWKYRFWKKIKARQLLVQSPEKFLYVIWNLVKKSYPKFVMSRSFFKILLEIFKTVKKIGKNLYGFWKIDEFILNGKNECHLIISGTIFFSRFVNNFLALLLRKIYVFGIFNMIDFFQIFVSYIAKYWNSDGIKLFAGSVSLRGHTYLKGKTKKENSIFFSD